MDTRALTWAALAAAAAAVTVLVARRRNARVGIVNLAEALGTLAGMLVLFVAPIVVLAEFSPAFDIAHLLYLGVVLALPVVAVALLVVGARRTMTKPAGVAGVALLLLAPVGWYGTHVAPYRLESVTATLALPPERAGTDPVRVGVLADLQTSAITSYEHRAVTELLALEPDVILVPGDLFQGDAAQYRSAEADFRRLLARLEAPGGVFAVRGDTDTGERMDRLVAGTDIRILDDEIATSRVGDRGILIGGNRLRWAPVEARAMRTELAASNPKMVRILMAHRPEVVLGLEESADIDLTVAGHTHGGQIAIPGFGPLVTSSPISRSVAAGGLHDVDGNPIFVSTGVGIARGEAPQVRLFTRPMVAVVELN